LYDLKGDKMEDFDPTLEAIKKLNRNQAKRVLFHSLSPTLIFGLVLFAIPEAIRHVGAVIYGAAIILFLSGSLTILISIIFLWSNRENPNLPSIESKKDIIKAEKELNQNENILDQMIKDKKKKTIDAQDDEDDDNDAPYRNWARRQKLTKDIDNMKIQGRI
jgi:hypothetical protein